MSRNTEYQFVPTDTETLVASLIAAYEKMTSITVQPASPEKLFIQWVANIIVQERALTNYAGNQNLPSRAEGDNLDALGELFFLVKRPSAQAATTTMRFTISEAQKTAILIPKGTRVTDASQKLFWETVADVYVEIGKTSAEVQVQCQTAGKDGNGYAVGQINTIVDVFDYYASCTNITESEEGSDAATDDDYYELMRSSMDGYSSAGARGGYVYFARQVSIEIGDVVANQPSPGCVNIYVLKTDGTLAGKELKAAVLAACSADEVRPLTDSVSVADGELVNYDIAFTYYTEASTTKPAVEIAADVQKAVDNYIAWQRGKFGRDINPDKLREFLSGTGIKRIVLTSPAFTKLRDGSGDTVPQVGKVGTVTITNGGYEDE